ncbi:dermonecrotic toxin domain-containing protein [Pseudomonas sp. microsymbiont 2]
MSTQAGTAVPEVSLKQLMDKLEGWAQAFDQRLKSQPTWLDTLAENIHVELRVYFAQGQYADGFLDNLLDTILQASIDGRAPVYDEALDAPHRWGQQVVQEIPQERRDTLVQLIEGMLDRLVGIYDDALRRHWQTPPMVVDDAVDFRVRLQACLDKHIEACKALVDGKDREGKTAQGLRAEIEELQREWHGQVAIQALSTDAETLRLQRFANASRPEWMKALEDSEETALRESHSRLEDALLLQQLQLEDFETLEAYARERARQFLLEETGYRMDPDQIKLHRRFTVDPGHPVETSSLTSQVMLGPLKAGMLQVISKFEAPARHEGALSVPLLERLLESVDAPADYYPALLGHYAQDDVMGVMKDAYQVRLQHSLLVAIHAGHIDQRMAERVTSTVSAKGEALQVRTLGVTATSSWYGLMLFYSENDRGELDEVVLYAPEKPDGQEWVVLHGPGAIAIEIGGWLSRDWGQAYLRSLTPVVIRAHAHELYSQVIANPARSSLGSDLRGLATGYAACLEEHVVARQSVHLEHVGRVDSPGWYRGLSLEMRRTYCYNRALAGWHEQKFDGLMAGHETFLEFARRKVREDIAPYLSTVGVTEAVDPETVLIDYHPEGDGQPASVMTLLDMSIFGYDHNWGIDNPARGVRSSVGQDLGRVRSADLADYARRAYLGQKYVEAIEADYLDVASDDYTSRREAFGQMLSWIFDRDLCQALGQQQITVSQYNQLLKLVSEAFGRDAPREQKVLPETVASTEGIFQLTLAGHPIRGAYVLRLIEGGVAREWLYVPDAPDQTVLRLYADLRSTAGEVLHEELAARATQATAKEVRLFLKQLVTGSEHLDSLREAQRVDALRTEFDVYIRHSLNEVSQITSTRKQVIMTLAIRGLIFASIPVALVCPPFALLMDVVFLLVSVRKAIIAHSKGDTEQALLEWLHASWALLGAFTHASRVLGALRTVTGVRGQVGSAARNPAPAIEQKVRLDKQWAVSNSPSGLTKAPRDGVWSGTRLGSDGKYYVQHKGRYFQVRHEPGEDFLRVVNARRPDAYFKMPVRVSADGRLQPVRPGLVGGTPVQDLGRVRTPAEAFSGNSPDVARGALQGEAVIGRFGAAVNDNYLFTLNVQSCVAVTLYNPVTKAGAVIHFDHNISLLITRAINEVLPAIQGATPVSRIRTVMVGGDWLTQASIGVPVARILRRAGLRPSWDHWSYSSCFGRTYGVRLDLNGGAVKVFQTSQDFVAGIYDPVLAAARFNARGLPGRAHRFMRRFQAEPLREGGNGAVVDALGRPADAAATNQQAISVIDLG